MCEAQVQQALFNNFRKKYKHVRTEVPALSRSIDIVYVNEDNDLISVEIKLHDWRHAIKQARDHQLVSDRAYICLPVKKRGVNKELQDMLDEYGIGLLLFEQKNKYKIDVTEFKSAKKYEFGWASSRNQVKQLVYS